MRSWFWKTLKDGKISYSVTTAPDLARAIFAKALGHSYNNWVHDTLHQMARSAGKSVDQLLNAFRSPGKVKVILPGDTVINTIDGPTERINTVAIRGIALLDAIGRFSYGDERWVVSATTDDLDELWKTAGFDEGMKTSSVEECIDMLLDSEDFT